MIKAYGPDGDCLVKASPGMDGAVSRAVWFDLVDPTPAEDLFVEAEIGVPIPTRDEMLEIETSSRLYVEDGATYMTAVLLCQADSDVPRTTAVTFILASDRLITVRYDEPRPFSLFEARACKPGSGVQTGRDVFIGLLDAVIDRLADILEKVGVESEQLSNSVFADGTARGQADVYTRVIKSIGRQGSLLGKIQESLVSLTRLLIFLTEETHRRNSVSADVQAHMRSMGQDLRSLSEHATALNGKNNFLLDATLGLVSLQQNTIVKIFSVLAVVFMPPTLIASIYGMNFHLMPELDWTYGYPMALGFMVASVAVTFAVFKWKHWL